MIRTFVALTPPAHLRHALSMALPPLPGRPVPPENLHVTLAFLGDLEDDTLQDLHDALSSLRAPPFEVQITGVGLFGIKSQHTIHADVLPTPALNDLHHQVLRAARGVGIQVERRRYVPHITLQRLRKGEGGAGVLARLQAHPLPPASFIASTFGLFRSDLHPGGARYAELASYPLGA